MMKLYVILICLCVGAATAAEKCEGCDREKCAPLTFCPSGITKDSCGCCDICYRRAGETCDYAPEVKALPVHGRCGEFLICEKGIEDPNKGKCLCGVEGLVCGSNGVTYETLCDLLEATEKDTELTVLERVPCKKGPVIKTPPKDARRPLKSILLLDCEAYGFPVPSITWELNKPDGSTVKLPSDDSFVAVQVRGGPEKNMVTGWVQIMRITPDNIGMYTCVATNEEGEARASSNVTFKKENPSRNEIRRKN